MPTRPTFDLEAAAKKVQNAITRVRQAIAEFNTELIAANREIQEALDDKTPVARSRSQMLAQARESAQKVGEMLSRARGELTDRPSSRPPSSRPSRYPPPRRSKPPKVQSS